MRYEYTVAAGRAGRPFEGALYAPPARARGTRLSFAAFGDMGDSAHLQAKSPGAGATLTTLKRLVDLGQLGLIAHVGDLSYANGNPSLWSSFLDSIEPLASRVPYMVSEHRRLSCGGSIQLLGAREGCWV